ncbi:unnamed protein product [Cylindrotheca closterium]|uniref:Citrate transporter-like domain-containing protein n=1 Tax=Cylindrotheca closterium TaxID=2856 RepID=A0AAD2FPZ4_9STRA|nr:unnamed protein product [Cylindrotheca closterium]
MPYRLSLSSAANIGAAMTLHGTPSNLLVSTVAYDLISWQEFFVNLLLPSASASIINCVLLLLFYRSELLYSSARVASNSEQSYQMILLQDESQDEDQNNKDDIALGQTSTDTCWSTWPKRRSILQIFGIVAFVNGFCAGLDFQRVFIAAGAYFMVLSLYNRKYSSAGHGTNDDSGDEAGDQVSTRAQYDYFTLVKQLGQFLIVGSLNDTGVPQLVVFNATALVDHCDYDLLYGFCQITFLIIIAAASTMFSSMAVVQMAAAYLPYSPPYAWAQTSFAANIAGNLAVFGSSTHYTIGDQFSKTTGKSSPMTFRRYALFGFFSGLLSLFVGTWLLSSFHSLFECSMRLGEC